MISSSQRPSKSVVLFWGKARKSAKREEGPPDHRLLCYVRIDIGAFLILEIIIIGGDKRSPKSWSPGCFYACVGTRMYVASICLDWMRMNVMHGTQFHHTRFDHRSRQTYAKHSNGAKVFWPSIIVANTPYPLVITSYYYNNSGQTDNTDKYGLLSLIRNSI